MRNIRISGDGLRVTIFETKYCLEVIGLCCYRVGISEFDYFEIKSGLNQCFLLLTASDILCFAVFLPSSYKPGGPCKIESLLSRQLTASLQ